MAKPQEIEEIEEKVILVGVSEQEGDDAEVAYMLHCDNS